MKNKHTVNVHVYTWLAVRAPTALCRANEISIVCVIEKQLSERNPSQTTLMQNGNAAAAAGRRRALFFCVRF